ncbi:hypothetical protein [Aliterella atlantica]|uniref:Uncharacterized protein n=1 Tax=Aliterella atlantica CENA595 TaxID=1618023 RepID=A0A0D8ZY24_9CYAN|nr:hypothetical protein [Aliterella atlantica]KJH73287.1 hypothetical protein UH38_00330 [Aliterella atlantica CENA595]
MERGLLWTSLLIVFIWLAWLGWNEYQKVEAYRLWAEKFENAKYDIYSVLAKNGTNITWGKPARSAPVDLKTFSLKDVRDIHLVVNDKVVSLDALPSKGESALEFVFKDPTTQAVRVPFTEIPLAAKWAKYLQQAL